MLGKINAGLIVLVYIPCIIVTPFYSYHMAVKNHQQKPYPAATITSTACHYPQDIVFRYFMLIASSILALIFYMLFRWLNYTASLYRFPQKLSKGLYYLSMFSILLYGITIGTIDEKGTGPLHSPCAVAFFIILMICVVQITIYLTNLRQWDTRAISKTSLRVKQLLTSYLIGVWIYCVIFLIAYSQQVDELQGKGDKYVVIVEWNTVTFCLLWVLSFYWEWKRINLCLIGPHSFEICQPQKCSASKTDKQIEMLNVNQKIVDQQMIHYY